VSQGDESLLEFPCRFPIKVMGEASDALRERVNEILERNLDASAEVTLEERASRAGRYLSITVTLTAQSREQLDTLYREFSAAEEILMAL
jgi:putative lipoic acid-binding regulatory protein